MLCKYCGKDTKDKFPYCMACGEWIGSSASRAGVPGSWGNPGFESRPRKAFLLRKEGEDGSIYWGQGRPEDVPAARLRSVDAAMADATRVAGEPPRHPATRGWYLHWRRA